MKKEALKKIIDAAAGRKPADLLIRNGIVADVYSGRFVKKDLLISEGLIAAIVEPGSGEGDEIFDAEGLYTLPGFIDSHIHIESSFLNPVELGRLLLPLGTCTIIADPHEIVNVCGIAGLNYMLAAAEDTAMDIKFMLPSCVPATPFEHSGAVLESAAMAAPIKNENILGLGEFMDYISIINNEKTALDKILLAKKNDKLIDGHSPGLSGRPLNAYAAASIHTDHECSTVEEMEQRLSLGMYVMLRQGSACHDLRNLIPGVTAENSRRCILCSDDYQPRTIFEQGHLNNDLRICVEQGIPPMTALRMATLNAAECYRLFDRGALAPGLRADIVLVEDIRNFKVKRVYSCGKLAADNGKYNESAIQSKSHNRHQDGIDDRSVRGSLHVKDFSAKKLALPLRSEEVWVIDVREGSVVTGKGKAKPAQNSSGFFIFDPAMDIAKIAVVERHQGTGNVGLGLIRGYGIRSGALALSVAHDSHNIIVVGVNDADMTAAVKRLIAIGGGVVIFKDGKMLEGMPLPLGGLMSDQSGEWVDKKIKSLEKIAVGELAVNKAVDPLMTLCFMSLPVIPELKITDMGLFDVGAFRFIPIEV
jgi:adenine deaminase